MLDQRKMLRKFIVGDMDKSFKDQFQEILNKHSDKPSSVYQRAAIRFQLENFLVSNYGPMIMDHIGIGIEVINKINTKVNLIPITLKGAAWLVNNEMLDWINCNEFKL